jgi:proliferating cell nuclear antigen PCNA
MNLKISDKHKKDLFIALFQCLKNCSSIINISFDIEKVHIQGMDKSHVCLYDLCIQNKWFNTYNVEELINLSFDANMFHLIISNKSDGYDILIHFNKNYSDNLNIDLIASENNKGEFNKYFKLPLFDYDYEELSLPNNDYEAEFSISAKKICEIFNQMSTFASDINIDCKEELIRLITNGMAGEMAVNIQIEDLNEFSIVEEEHLNITYSLTYLNKICMSNKLSNSIDFYISQTVPMKIKYDLGDDSILLFFMAPKIID